MATKKHFKLLKKMFHVFCGSQQHLWSYVLHRARQLNKHLKYQVEISISNICLAQVLGSGTTIIE